MASESISRRGEVELIYSGQYTLLAEQRKTLAEVTKGSKPVSLTDEVKKGRISRDRTPT